MTIQISSKRQYARRSDDERIADLQRKINQLQGRIEKKQRKDLPVLKEVPRVQRRLRKFVQLAMDNGRQDLAHSTMAFIAGLDRALNASESNRKRSDDEDEDA